jgi:hypothetical protein
VSEHGVPFERTRLAWRRTLLAVATVAVLAARLAVEVGAAALVAVALAGWAALFWVARRRQRKGSAAKAGAALPVFALATAGYAVLGTIMVIVG